jgi:hypothetical protein
MATVEHDLVHDPHWIENGIYAPYMCAKCGKGYFTLPDFDVQCPGSREARLKEEGWSDERIAELLAGYRRWTPE